LRKYQKGRVSWDKQKKGGAEGGKTGPGKLPCVKKKKTEAFGVEKTGDWPGKKPASQKKRNKLDSVRKGQSGAPQVEGGDVEEQEGGNPQQLETWVVWVRSAKNK